MGKASTDIKRDIERTRDDVSATVEELERRARRTLDLRAQAEEHPFALRVVGAGLLTGISVLTYNVVTEYRARRKPVNRLRRRAGEMADDLGERWTRTRESLPVRVSTRREDESMDTTAQQPGMIKKILWAGLAAATVALFGLLARRTSSTLWEMFMKEPPPTSKV